MYNNKDVATASMVTASLTAGNFTPAAGVLAGNYTLPTTASGAGHITALTVTGSIIGDPTKPYDGNTNATLTAANFSLSGLIGSEAFTVTKTTGTYNSKDVLTANTVSTSLAAGDFTPVSGAIATNYTLPTTASGAGHITPASVTPAVTAIDKPYDGNNTATINACTLTGVISPDVVTCSDSATFSSPNAGTWTVTATGITLGGAQAGNYVLSSNSATTTAKINPKALTASIINNPTKPYDGNTTATLTPANFSVIGIVGAESITVTKTTGIYNSKDVATASTVTATLAGTDFAAGGGTLLTNYMLPTTVSGTGHITAVTVTASIIGNPTKPYDGNTYATLTAANFSLAGLVAGESITVTKTSGTYNDKNVAAASTVTATLAGGDFAPVGGALLTNYALPVSASGGGHITARALAVIATGVNKVYDSTTAAMVTLSDNRLSGDVFTDNYGSATFATPNVGTLIPVTVNGIWIAGTDSGNYTFNSTTTTVANITPASPTTTLASSLSTATTPVGVVLKATVASTVVPTGSVKFTDITTSTVLGTISLASGQATLTVTTLGVGPHVVSASYIPDTANFTGSVSGADDAPGVTITGPPSGTVQAVNTTFNFTATFTDTTPQTHSGAWSFDTASIPGTVDDVNGTVTASYSFATAGVYGVKLTVNDGAGGITIANTVSSANAPLNLSAQVVVYDPSSGFVTGGGWINSPAGAYTANTTLTGKATFGFVSKYEKGANVPTGETEFNFQVANFNFHSALYQWLVISGPMAQYKGSGTINGSGNYNFILTGRDGALVGGNSPDGFRIKITDPISGSVIYDNLLSTDDSMTSANTQTLGGGSIVVHSK